MADTHYYYSRYSLGEVLSNNLEFLRTGISSEKTIEKNGFIYQLLDIEEINFDGELMFTGFLAKIKPEDSYQAADTEHGKMTDIIISNNIVASVRFFVHPTSAIIFHNEVGTIISKDNVARYFELLFEKNSNTLLFRMNPIEDQYSFIDALKEYTTIKKLIIEVVPSNPHYGDKWKSIDERLKRRNVSKEVIKTENTKEGQSIKIDEEDENHILMTEDGYGNSQADVIDPNTGKKKTLSTSKSKRQKKAAVSPELTKHTEILQVLASTLQEIINRTKK